MTELRRLPVAVVLTVALAGVCWPNQAWSNGAFPDSGQLLLPADRKQQIGIGTNFGLILSEDGGGTWSWVCETEPTNLGRLYQTNAEGRIFAISTSGLVYSDDNACSWSRAGGALEPLEARDAYVEKPDTRRVLAVATAGPDTLMTVHRSLDGGLSFGDVLRTAEVNEVLTGVESAASDPNVIYLASYIGPGVGSNLRITRSSDGGGSWQVFPLPSTLNGMPGLVMVDPEDPARIFLRISPALSGDSLVLSTDGGATYRTILGIAGRLTAFLRQSDGTLLVAAETNGAGFGFQSHDGGESFVPWSLPLRVRALGERDGVLYAASSNFEDGTALATSHDQGKSWQPVIRYQDVQRIKSCAFAACQMGCVSSAQFGLWPESVCTPGGNTGNFGGITGNDGGPADGIDADRPPAAGCGCRTGGSGHDDSLVFLLLIAAALSFRPRRA